MIDTFFRLCYPRLMVAPGVDSTPLPKVERRRVGRLFEQASALPVAQFRRWYWAFIPLLAVAAYATVIRVGFLSDDLGLYFIAGNKQGIAQTLLPDSGQIWYRPIGFLITWQLGRQLWGDNPFPYHLIGLLVHAAAALALGLWLAEATSRRSLGWLAGALFAVFPLNLEAVGWVAAQWDAWATLFGLLSLWLFTRWWRSQGDAPLYLLSALSFLLGVFTKESLFTFLPLYALSAWVATPRFSRPRLRKLAVSLIPLGAMLALNIFLRFLAWGGLRNYPWARADYGNFFWDELTTRLRMLISPVNATLLGNNVEQVVAASVSTALLVGLALFGRAHGRLLVMSAAWIALSLVTTLNLPVTADSLQNNRFLYLAAAGYCVGLAVLLYSAVSATSRMRLPALAFTGLLILISGALCWVQLRPFYTASLQVRGVESELKRLIPPQERPGGMAWYVENVPRSYDGVYVLESGLGRTRYIADGGVDFPRVTYVQNAQEAPIAAETRAAFALRFAYNEEETLFHVNYGVGITDDSALPSLKEAGNDLTLWNFTGCAPAALYSWQVTQAQSGCEVGKGLLLSPASDDPQMANLTFATTPDQGGARFVRLRASVQYAPASPDVAQTLQWFWANSQGSWSEDSSSKLQIKGDGQPHVYWAFIPLAAVGKRLAKLRFDPINSQTIAQVRWIAVDLVK
ncbi:MAG: hypothetical protein IVW55_03380 [Chloroflexi bacterium]|nr:hypothetical protein [Chloroflexota bacterium]